MSERTNRWSDQQIERLVGRLLQIGVLASAVVVAAGGAIYLAQRGGTLAGHHVFRGEPERLRRIPAIAVEAVHLHARGMIQFGLLLLVFTPICRVALTAAIFLVQRDYVFLAIALFVLAVLLFGLFVRGCCRGRRPG